MAYDLILGRLPRDWSSGSSQIAAPPPAPSTVLDAADMPPKALADATKTEINLNVKLAASLASSGRLPDADLDAFRRFLRKWQAYYTLIATRASRKGQWTRDVFTQDDLLQLWNFRKLNEGFGKRLSAFELVAKTPLVPKTDPKKEIAKKETFSPPGAERPPAAVIWPYLLGTGLVIAGLGFLGTKYV